MLRSLTFRSKLLCTLAVPMVALLAITAIAGRDRLDQATRANELGDRIGIVTAALDLDHRVQEELTASANRADAAGLASRRSAVDEAAQALTAIIGGSQGGTAPYDLAAGRVRKDLGVLGVYRSAVDSGSPVTSFAVTYGELSSSLSDLASAVADGAADPLLARQTAALAALSRVADASANEAAILDAAFTRGSFGDGEAQLFANAVDARAQWEGVYQGLAQPEAKADLRVTMVGQAVNTAQSMEIDARKAGLTGTLTADAKTWREASGSRLDLLHGAQTRAVDTLSATAGAVVDAAQDDLRTFALIAGAAILVATALALVLAQTVTRPLRKLTKAARHLADDQLPQLVDGLKAPGPEDQRFLKVAIEPIVVRSNDELGQLAGAFNAVQQVAVDVAAEQAELLRKGIGDIFVSLARRNQVLIDRQIEFLDELEAKEDDPDQLGSLYRLDHLATRMRRNAESLLVLAGMEPTRRRSKPVPLVDVVRAAIGETEEYARVEIIGFSEVEVAGAGAVDLGHLLAELLENATHFSPPDTRVTVEGRLGRSGYVVSIVDAGIGMGTEQLADANGLLASPPPVGLALGRSLGFTVVSRLAARHGVSVRLMPAGAAGVSAVVHLPAHLIVGADDPVDATPPAATAPLPTPGAPLGPVFEAAEPPTRTREPAFTALDDDAFEAAFQRAWGDDAVEPAPDLGGDPVEATAASDEVDPWMLPDEGWQDGSAEPASLSWIDDDLPEPVAPADPADGSALPRRTPSPVAAADSLEDALPTGPAFDRGLSELMRGDDVLGPPSLVEPPVEVPADLGRADRDAVPAAAPAAEPAATEAPDPAPVTAAGLVRRVPKSVPAAEQGGAGRPSVAANKRSPDEVRAMLAKYRTGLQRGRGVDEGANGG